MSTAHFAHVNSTAALVDSTVALVNSTAALANSTVTHLKSNVPSVDSIRQLANMSGLSLVSFIKRFIIIIE
jgi:hypothetical protein